MKRYLPYLFLVGGVAVLSLLVASPSRETANDHLPRKAVQVAPTEPEKNPASLGESSAHGNGERTEEPRIGEAVVVQDLDVESPDALRLLELREWRRLRGYYASEEEREYYMSMDLEMLLKVTNNQADMLAVYTAGKKTVNSSPQLSLTYFAFASALGSTPALIDMAELYISGTLTEKDDFDGSVVTFPADSDSATNGLALVILAEDRGDSALASQYFRRRIDLDNFTPEMIEAACNGAHFIRRQLEDLRVQMGQGYFDDAPPPRVDLGGSENSSFLRQELCSE